MLYLKLQKNNFKRLKKIILNRTGKMNAIVEMVDEIEAARAGKWKFFVRMEEEG